MVWHAAPLITGELATYSPSSIYLSMITLKYLRVEHTNHNSPDVDEGKENEIRKFMEREDEWKNVVGHTLGVAVKGVESMAGIWSRHNPLVMRLVQVPVDQRMV